MPDIVPPEVRSRMMSGIRCKNTRPEVAIRKELFSRGFRYRLHAKELPGKPDIVFPRYRAVVFIHGCFWHGHDCHLFRLPSTRLDFWETKIARNRANDGKAINALQSAGWRVATVWECSVKGKKAPGILKVGDALAQWLESTEANLEIRGQMNYASL